MYRVSSDKIKLLNKVIEKKYDGAVYLTEREDCWKVAWTATSGVNPDNGRATAKAICEIAEIAERLRFENVRRIWETWEVDDADYIEQEQMLTEALKKKNYEKMIDWLVGRL